MTFGYAVSLFVGGLLGLNHVDPNTSTCFGLINAIGATYGAYQIHENPNAITGKSLSEALIFASTNQQYDNRLFIDFLIDLQVQ